MRALRSWSSSQTQKLRTSVRSITRFGAALLRVQRVSTLPSLPRSSRRRCGERPDSSASCSIDSTRTAAAPSTPKRGMRRSSRISACTIPRPTSPLQARRLYLKNWLRLIFDADQKPARIVPALRPDTGAPLDLSFSVLRSVSPIHIEYMKNMGVRASMSISLIVRDQLWGLISCLNHTGPRRVSHRMRSACEFMGRLASLQIASFEDRELIASRASRRATEDALHSAMSGGHGQRTRGPCRSAHGTDGPGRRRWRRRGGEWRARHVRRRSAGGRHPRDRGAGSRRRAIPGRSLPIHSGVHFPPALAASDVASGLLTFALPDARLMWFRPEVIQTVNWGGDPTKPVGAEAGTRLRPRHSFALWKEEVRARSRPWTPSDLEAAEELRRRATEVDLQRRLLSEQRAVRARDEMLAVVSHDLREPTLRDPARSRSHLAATCRRVKTSAPAHCGESVEAHPTDRRRG